MPSSAAFLLAALLLLRLSKAAVVSSRSTSNPTVTLASGLVEGTTLKVLNQPANTGIAKAYLGVPFASPPERFAPPKAVVSWNNTLHAQTLPPICLQQFGSGPAADKTRKYFDNPGGQLLSESEDCLYLNIYAPQDADTTNLRPVMFWLFGGNFQFGGASYSLYNGSSFAANQDIVVVAPNCRSGIFGFSNSPDIPFGEQNSALLDARFALQWTKNNIRAFGGDPEKVTIFGESSGAEMVKQLLAQPPSPLPFRAAIMQSQGASVPGNGRQQWQQVTDHFDCSNATSPIDCVRKIPAGTLLGYVNQLNLGFPPVENDGTYTPSVLTSLQSGKFADVPIFIGTNKDEGGVFLATDGLSDNAEALVNAIVASYNETLEPILPSLRQTYPEPIASDTNVFYTQVLTDLIYTCSTSTLSSAIMKYNKSPVWRYRYDAAFPNLAYFPDAGAFHSAELPTVWGTYQLVNQYGNATVDQIALSKYMQGLWANFARTQGIADWLSIDRNSTNRTLGLLGDSARPSGVNVVNISEADAPCTVLGPFIEKVGKGF